MRCQLQRAYASVLETRTKDELFGQLVGFTRELEFETVTAVAVIDRGDGTSTFSAIDNAPAAFAAIDTPERGKRDPVMQHCKYSGRPIIWDQSTYVKAGLAASWEEQATFGYRNGICLALHLPAGRHFVLGVDRDQPFPRDARTVMQMTAALALYAMQMQEVAMPLLLAPCGDESAPSLSARELETLRWTMEGKTAWEIGRILGIAENTAIRHAHNASRKLGCSGKHHAAMKALRLGLIQ